MSEKIDEDTIHNRAEILEEVQAEVLQKSLKAEIGKEVDIVIDGESEEHEFLLSAKELIWAPEIDGEIYVNDRTDDEAELLFGKVYKAKITSIVGDILTATVDNKV
jgi:tRNA A37 methylthiotransferase MiaB